MGQVCSQVIKQSFRKTCNMYLRVVLSFKPLGCGLLYCRPSVLIFLTGNVLYSWKHNFHNGKNDFTKNDTLAMYNHINSTSLFVSFFVSRHFNSIQWGKKIKLNISIRLKESYCKRLFSTANDLTKCSEKRNI